MKKLFLMVLCLISIAVQAQQVHFIPKAGMNIANMTNSEGSDPRIGLHVGAAAEISLTPQFSIEPGVFYSMQGIKATEDGVTATLKNDYINVPVLAKYYVYEGFNIFAGPQVGLLLNSKAGGSYSGVSTSVDVKDAFKSIDFAAVVGIGYQTAIGLNFSANYNLGLVNILDGGTIGVGDEDIDFGDIGTTKNNVIQVSVGWRF